MGITEAERKRSSRGLSKLYRRRDVASLTVLDFVHDLHVVIVTDIGNLITVESRISDQH